MMLAHDIGVVRDDGLSRRTHFEDMAWAVPEYTRNQVDNAGFVLVDPAANPAALALEQAYDVINNWRSAHSYPLNTFQNTLRKKCAHIARGYIVAQRIKRLASIRLKLERQSTMQLSQMQDIGGCRAVLSSVNQVNTLVNLYKRSRFDHIQHNSKNYIEYPKRDGYRGVHLIYRYRGIGVTAAYSEQRIEVQIRSSLQHAWATAVETVGIFTQQALKSNLGNPEWLRFFSLMGSVISQIEKTPLVPGTPEKYNELIEELGSLSDKLHVVDALNTYGATLKFLTQRKPKREKYYLLQLEPEAGAAFYNTYAASASQEANTAYLALERTAEESIKNLQVVLVSVDSIAALRRAYPNYFGDTKRFRDLLIGVLGE